MGKSIRSTEDGLPILGNHSSDTLDQTEDGLPILKKKDTSAGSKLPASPSASTVVPPKTEVKTDISELNSQLDVVLNAAIFSGDKQAAPLKKKFQGNYKNGVLTPQDAEAVGTPSSDIPPDQIANGINNKSANLDAWGNAPIKDNISASVKKIKDIDNKITELKGAQTSPGENSLEIATLENQKKIVKTDIQKSYDVEKRRIVPDLVNNIKTAFGSASWNDIYENPDANVFKTDDELRLEAGNPSFIRKSPIKWNPETHKITPESAQYVYGQVDKMLNKKGNDALDAVVSGDLDKKERTYNDVGNEVINYLNTVIPVQHEQKKYAEEFAKKNPKIKDAINAQSEFNSFFSKDNVDAANAYANTWRDKEFMKTGEKYYSKTGVLNQNPEYVKISNKYAEMVHNGTMSDEIARKEIDQEAKQNPAIKKVIDNYENDVKGINDKTRDMFQQFIVNGLKKVDNKLTVYKDGSVGLDGISMTEYKKLTKEYQDGYNDIPKKVLGEQDAAVMKQANKNAENVGPFWASVGGSTNDLSSAFSKFLFNKTQWGGNNVRYFQAQESSSPQISQSDVAKRWNWKGVESLGDPKFWAAKIGGMVPVLAGGAAITAATEGEGIPAYISWLANAGLFTAQNGLSTYNQLLNTKDVDGNQLSEADASEYMANDMKRSFLPNLLMMAATSGTLFRSKNIVKPTISRTIGQGVKSAAIAQPFFTWQGYESYANLQEAQGKKTDLWDYMQTDDFRDNLVNGMVVGSGLSLLHAPGSYIKGMKSWTNLVHTSEGEFKNLSLHNYALQQEMAGNGNYLRDALKMHVFNNDEESLGEPQKRELQNLKDVLKYSVNLERNIKGANLDPSNIKDLYQGHNLALADSYDELAEKNKDNKNLSSIYSDKAKEYREQAKGAADGTAKYHYLINDDGKPIFLSDNSFKVLDKEGKIDEWIKNGTIEDVRSSDDPKFGDKYRTLAEEPKEVSAPKPFVPKLEETQQSQVIDALRVAHAAGELSPGMKDLADLHLDNPDAHKELAENVISQAVDNQSAMKEALGKEAYKKIEPIIQEQKALSEEEKANPSTKESTPAEPEKSASPAGEYKPNIRDDYFAKADFFTPEEKEKFSTLDEAGQDKMIDDKRAELKEGPVRNATNIAQPILDRMNNAEYINEKELDTAADSLYDLLDKVDKMEGYTPEQKSSVNSMIEPLIKKIEDYDFRTKTETSTVTEKVPTQVLREGKKREVKPALEQSKGGKATVKLADGTEKSGTLNIKDGNYVLDVPGEDPLVIGEKAITDRDLKLPSEDRVPEPIGFDKNGDVESVTFETKDGRLVTVNDPEKALDIAIQLRAEAIGQVSPEQFETVWSDVQKEIQQEVPVKDLSSQKIENDEKTKAPEEAEGRQGDDVTPEAAAPEKPVVSSEEPPVPPKPPKPEVRTPAESPKEEFTSVRKEKNKEIKGVKALFERQKKIKWTQTYENALSNLQGMYPGKGIYDAMKSRIDHFVSLLDSNTLFNPTSEDISVFNVFKDETKRRINEIQGWDSPDNIQRLGAVAEFTLLQNDLFNVARVTNPGGEAGRAFNLLQSEVGQDPDTGLKLRRMALLGAKGGGKLTEEELSFTADNWDKEKDLIQKEQSLKEKGMREKFDKQLSAVRDAYEKKLKDAKAEKKPASEKEKREKLLSQKGADLAARIRKGKDVFKGGTMVTFPGLPQAINLVLEGLAKLVEGGYSLAQAIDEYVKANKIKNKEQFQNDLFEVFNKQEKQEDAFDKIEKFADTHKVTDVTNEMVGKGLIKDYIDAHVGLHEPVDVLDVVHSKLEKVLPDLEKNRLLEAYLKKGEFEQPTKEKLESGFKESQKKFDRLTNLEKDINDLNEKKNLFKKKNNKVNTPFDKDINQKEQEKKDIMNSMGVKTSGEDKYTKASYDERAKNHNDRIDDISNDLLNKIDKVGLSTESENLLNKLNNQLEAAKIKIDPTSALSQEKTLAGGISLLNSIKSEFDRSAGNDPEMKEIRRALQKTIDKFNSDKEDSEQNIKLQRAKDQAKRDMDKTFQKISNGEYEEKQPVVLTKTDAELIKAQRDRDALNKLYQDKRREFEKGKKTPLRRVFDFARAAMVDWMIGSIGTLAKVGGSAIIRPNLEAATKITFGKGFEALPFDTTKAITERAKAGGEGSSIKSIQKAYGAYLKPYSPDQIKGIYDKANYKYEESDKAYQQAKGSGASDKELEKLKNQRDGHLIDAVSTSMYQFIGGSSVKEALEVLLHRSTQMERQFGDFDREGWQAGGLKNRSTALDNAEYVMNFVGRSHAALKNFSARFSFATGFVARLENAVANGADISNPDKILEIAHSSYLDFERGKYQESNWVTDTWNKVTNKVESASPELAYLMRADVAITRVPVNMLREGIMEYTLGAVRGSVMAAKEYYKAKGIVLQDGYTPDSDAQFKAELREQLNKIDPDKAATIIRSFRKGGFGAGLYALALLGHAAFGGWAHKGQTAEDKKKAAREEETGVPEIKTGEIKIGDWKIPETVGKIIEHTPAFAPLGFGLGLAQVYGNNIIDGRSTPASALNSAMAQVNHITGSIPMLDRMVLPLAAGALGNIKPSGQWDDVDEDGNPMKRKAFRMSDYLNYLHVPYTTGFKKDVLSEYYYKEAVKNQKYYRDLITEVETNTSLSKQEKENQRKQYLTELNESIDEVYKQNKENPQ